MLAESKQSFLCFHNLQLNIFFSFSRFCFAGVSFLRQMVKTLIQFDFDFDFGCGMSGVAFEVGGVVGSFEWIMDMIGRF